MDMNYLKSRNNDKKSNNEKTIDIISDHFPISERELENRGLPNNIRGLDVVDTVTVPGKGIVFYGRHNVQIAQFRYIQSKGGYEFQFNEAAKDTIETGDLLERRKERRRKMKLQRRRKAIALGLSGLIVIGALGFGIHHVVAERNEQSAYEQYTPYINVHSVPDNVKLAWANYAMNQYQEKVNDSQYEQVKYQAENLYQQYFAPIFSSYYNYCEIATSDLERELSGDYCDRLHNQFEENLELFEERLITLTFGDSLVIGNTPYANAIVLDEGISPENKVYIPISALPEDNPYGMNNLPEGAQIVDNQIYVPESCLYDTLRQTK